jgi:CPA1 family monovalent cation:H+ antiporter
VKFEVAFVVLFSIATAVAIAARHFRLPYTVALVVAGLVVNSSGAFEPPHLTQELLFAVILPGLLFEAAFQLDVRQFLKNKLAIHSLAIPGLAAAVGLTAILLTPLIAGLHFVDDFVFIDGLLFAAVIAATDPIAVVGLFKSLGAPKRLAVLVEGESLFNDGTGVVIFTIILSVAMGGAFSASGALLAFIRIAGGGLLVGLTIGFAVSQVILRVDDAMVEITLTVIAAYGSFVLAERFHLSGVIATVAAGMLCGNYGRRLGMSPTTRVAVQTFWEYWAFALNSVVFLLVGLEIRLRELFASWSAIVAAFVCVLVARAIVVVVVSFALRRSDERIPANWSAVLVWSGLRGALSMVLVLGLPRTFAHRDLLVNMTFGVVVLSILLQGTTMSWVLRRLGVITRADPDREQLERARARLRAARAAVDVLGKLEAEAQVEKDEHQALRDEYAARMEEAQRDIAACRKSDLDEAHRVWRKLLETEKATLADALREGLIGSEVYEELVTEANARLDAGPPSPDGPPSE